MASLRALSAALALASTSASSWAIFSRNWASSSVMESNVSGLESDSCRLLNTSFLLVAVRLVLVLALASSSSAASTFSSALLSVSDGGVMESIIFVAWTERSRMVRNNHTSTISNGFNGVLSKRFLSLLNRTAGQRQKIGFDIKIEKFHKLDTPPIFHLKCMSRQKYYQKLFFD